MSNIVISNGAAITFPGNGKGTGGSKRGNTSSASTTFTLTTVTDAAASWTLTGAVAGDMAITSDGLWGIVVVYVGAANNSVLTVDRWRKPGLTSPPPQFTPAATSTVQVFSACELAGFGFCTLQKIMVLSGTGTLSVIDINGVVFPGLAWTIGATTSNILDFGDDSRGGGWDLDRPFAIQMSSGVAMAVYKSGGRVG